MINCFKTVFGLCLIFAISNCQLLPYAGYQHDIAFPAITGQFHTSTMSDNQPVRQISAGFHLNPLPPLPILQSFPLGPEFLNGLKSRDFPGNQFLRRPLKNLFTPNTFRQRPESDGQDEEYRKYLKEEAEQFEKENQPNELTTDFTDFSIETTSLQPRQKSYVKLNVQGKDYTYST